MKKQDYNIMKDDAYIKIVSLNIKKLNGLKFKPSNKRVYDGIKVNKMTLINNTFVEKVLKRKIKKRLEVYLNYIMSLVESDDEEDASTLGSALDDLSKYKDTIKYKYKIYLEQKYVSLLLKKIELLEKEIEKKLMETNQIVEERRRSR